MIALQFNQHTLEQLCNSLLTSTGMRFQSAVCIVQLKFDYKRLHRVTSLAEKVGLEFSLVHPKMLCSCRCRVHCIFERRQA
jgi:hypothetical protein